MGALWILPHAAWPSCGGATAAGACTIVATPTRIGVTRLGAHLCGLGTSRRGGANVTSAAGAERQDGALNISPKNLDLVSALAVIALYLDRMQEAQALYAGKFI